MGYQRSTLKLQFVDPQFNGLEVRMRRMSIGQLNEVSKFSEIDLNKITEEEGLEAVKAIVSYIEPKLISWNYEDEEGKLIPANKEGLLSTDLIMLINILQAWMSASVDVAAPLDQQSKDGNGSDNGTPKMSVDLSLAKLPMDAL